MLGSLAGAVLFCIWQHIMKRNVTFNTASPLFLSPPPTSLITLLSRCKYCVLLCVLSCSLVCCPAWLSWHSAWLWTVMIQSCWPSQRYQCPYRSNRPPASVERHCGQRGTRGTLQPVKHQALVRSSTPASWWQTGDLLFGWSKTNRQIDSIYIRSCERERTLLSMSVFYVSGQNKIIWSVPGVRVKSVK